MRFLQSLLGLHSVWQVEWALTVVLQVTIVCVTALIAVQFVRTDGRLRHRIWLGAMTATILVPALSLWIPAIRVTIAVPAGLVYIDNAVRLEGTRAAIASWLGAAPGPLVHFVAPQTGSVLGNDNGARGPGIFSWVVLCWMAGGVLVLGRTVAGMFRLRALARSSRPVTGGRIRALATGASHQLGLEAVPHIAVHHHFSTPVTFGARRPIVLLPTNAVHWKDERLRLVLAHELAHVRRRDWLVQLLARAVCAANWFNPLVWLAARELRFAAEIACDQHAVGKSAPGAACGYAAELLAIAATSTTAARFGPAANAMPFFVRGELNRRIRVLLSTHRTGESSPWMRRAVVAVLCALPFAGALRATLGSCGSPRVAIGPIAPALNP